MSRSLPRSIFLVTSLVLANAGAAWARCGVSHQLANLQASPTKCSAKQLVALQQVLANRLEFRESLDLPLARKVLQERKCPSTDDLRAFVDAWKQLPGTGFSYTAKRYCLAAPTVYSIRFPAPDRPLDDAVAAKLAADVDRLESVVIPALTSKRAEVDALAR